MRGVALAFAMLAAGCATSVQRLDGEVKTPAGPASTPCEQRSWLVIAPTRTEWADRGDKLTHKRDDALGLYRVGGSFPESIPGLSKELGPSPMLQRHDDSLSHYDNKRLLAAILGVAGVATMVVGGVVFANSFETTTTTNAAGQSEEQHNVVAGRAALGGILVGVGFGLGIGGIVASPSQGERARADSWRYTFLPPDDAPKDVEQLVERHNQGVKNRCAK